MERLQITEAGKANGPGEFAGPVQELQSVDDYMLTKPKSTPVY
jgi:hypothetical protein